MENIKRSLVSLDTTKDNTVTCIPIARQRLGKHIPAKRTQQDVHC
jgi:hypothetical protein